MVRFTLFYPLNALYWRSIRVSWIITVAPSSPWWERTALRLLQTLGWETRHWVSPATSRGWVLTTYVIVIMLITPTDLSCHRSHFLGSPRSCYRRDDIVRATPSFCSPLPHDFTDRSGSASEWTCTQSRKGVRSSPKHSPISSLPPCMSIDSVPTSVNL